MILKEALPPSNRTVQIVLTKAPNGKVLTARKKSFWGLLTACRQLRAETLPHLRPGIILDIENDGNHNISIEQLIPRQECRDLVTAVFYQLPKVECANGNTFPLLDSILTLRNLHTLAFRTRNVRGKTYDKDDGVQTYDEIRDNELDIQDTSNYRKLELTWPEKDYESPEHDEIVVDDLCAARPDVCIMFIHEVSGPIGCQGECKEKTWFVQSGRYAKMMGDCDWDDESDESDGDSIEDYDSECECPDQEEWDAIAIKEPHQTSWRFVDRFFYGDEEKELEKQFFGRVKQLEA